MASNTKFSAHPVARGFGMSSHSKRGEILQLRQNLERKFVSHFPSAEEVGNSEPVALDPGKIVEAIETRGKTVDSKEITETLGSIRLAWSQNISGYPTAEEIDALTQRLCNGFTTKQLQSYFVNKESSVPLPSQMELLEPRWTPLYTRSSWKFGTTPFPTPANPNSQSNSPQSKARTIPGRDKRKIAQKIVQKRWQLRARRRCARLVKLIFCSQGQYSHCWWNIVRRPPYDFSLDFDLTDIERNILERLAQQFEAKTDLTAVPPTLTMPKGDTTSTPVTWSLSNTTNITPHATAVMPLKQSAIAQAPEQERLLCEFGTLHSGFCESQTFRLLVSWSCYAMPARRDLPDVLIKGPFARFSTTFPRTGNLSTAYRQPAPLGLPKSMEQVVLTFETARSLTFSASSIIRVNFLSFYPFFQNALSKSYFNSRIFVWVLSGPSLRIAVVVSKASFPIQTYLGPR